MIIESLLIGIWSELLYGKTRLGDLCSVDNLEHIGRNIGSCLLSYWTGVGLRATGHAFWSGSGRAPGWLNGETASSAQTRSFGSPMSVALRASALSTLSLISRFS